jgi:hypothetical protein
VHRTIANLGQKTLNWVSILVGESNLSASRKPATKGSGTIEILER